MLLHSVTLVISDSATPLTVAARLLCPWDSSGKNTGVGCHALLKGIFLTQGANSSILNLLHCWQILYPLEPPGKPKYELSNPDCEFNGSLPIDI